VAYTTAEGRTQLLDELGDAADALARALADLSEAYEHLDDAGAERLEEALFRPVQQAYGRARRTYTEFAAAHELPARAFETPPVSAPGAPTQVLVERAVSSVEESDAALAALQDSMLPVEVGDPQLRAALSDVRTTLDHTRAHARELLRTLGR
jgi:ABC-type transporter Mla subunit MlaD